ncbi:MAG TPA: MFS transporter [Terracidiphilus sp.]|nr:MFS transporter [Terracidiphilus sp.]
MPTEKPPALERGALAEPFSHQRLTRWHWATIVLLAVGYMGYYFCRSNFSVVLPLLIQEMGRHGMTADAAKIHFGTIVSAGVFAYAIGKFLSGSMADLFGGRKNFLGGMAGSIVFTLVFAASGTLPFFTLAWIGNRLVQSGGWAGLVKVASRWFSYSRYGSVMGVLCLSYLFGDAACRYIMSVLLHAGMGWRGIFVVGAASLAVLLVLNGIFLREMPEERGSPSPQTNPLNVYAGKDDDAENERLPLGAILRPLLTSIPFWLVCLLSVGTTLLRETFNFWTPTYFVQYVGLNSADAASRSALFPLLGGVSVVVCGVLSDRLGLNGRNRVLFGGLSLVAFCLLALALTPPSANPWVAVSLVALTGFALLGPYAYLSGAISLDFGGKRGSATAAGIMDGLGYLAAGLLSGDTMARVTVHYGWRNAFLMLAGVGFLTAVVAFVLVVHQHKREPLASE